MSPATEQLLDVLERARAVGLLGPGPVDAHIRHSQGFAAASEQGLGRDPAHFADLGTGGGIPGLVLGERWTGAHAIFVETRQRRCAWLRDAVDLLGLEDRIEVVEQRAEATSRSEEYREHFDLVTARSFAGPAVTAEIAAGLVRVGGILVVSEPPVSDGERWPTNGLLELGFGPAEPVEVDQAHFVVVRKVSGVAAGVPRGPGRPAKRPLW